MSSRGSSYRHELKYMISTQESALLRQKLEQILPKDQNAVGGGYHIRSLYFDDLFESAYEDKMAGIESRKKYRIRIYNYSDRQIRLECKHKEGQYIKKETMSLTKDEAQALIGGDPGFLMGKKDPLGVRFYMEHLQNRLHPSVIVDYDRIPFVYPYGNVRITFDSDVRAGVFVDDLFDTNLPVMQVMERDKLILEVKYTEYLPELVRCMLPVADSAYIAYSKYTMCLEKKKELSTGF